MTESSSQATPAARVLYIVGHPRCGSTIVGNVLAEIKQVFHAGELHYLWTPHLPEPRRRCGCGELVRDCPIWRRIFSVAFDASDEGPPADADPAAAPASGLPGVDAEQVYDLQRRALHRPGSAAAAAYLRLMEKLYGAIAEVTGSRLVVDSSKWPHAARLIGRIVGVELSFLHLIREPWGAVYSRLPRDRSDRPGSARPPRRSRVLLESLRWLKSNTLAEMVVRRSGRHGQTLLYEDFTQRPAAVASTIAALTELSWPTAPLSDGEVQLNVNHTTGGNRNRWQSGRIEIRHDRKWRDGMRRSDVHLVSLATWPYRLRYGYRP